MKSRLNILITAAVLLLFFNIIKWSGIFKSGSGADSESEIIRKLTIDIQKPADPLNVKVKRNMFSGRLAGEFFVQPGDETGNMAHKRVAAAVTPTAVPEKKWPEFKISGIATSEGKKCAFFTGSAFKGAVNEGSEINDNYRLVAINEHDVEIVDKITNETRKFSLEGK